MSQFKVSTDTVHASGTLHGRHRSSQLLQLPDTALDLVLQQLNSCSLASTAATCSQLRETFAAHSKKVVVRCRDEETHGSFALWLDRNSSSMRKLEECSVFFYTPVELDLTKLPSSHLRSLQLQNVKAQFSVPTVTCLPVLQDSTGLTALDLAGCHVQNTPAATAAIAALPQLQHLRICVRCGLDGGMDHFHQFQHPTNLTNLSVSLALRSPGQVVQQLSSLSALVNLQRLNLAGLSVSGFPGGLLSELVQLTCLAVSYRGDAFCVVSEQFKHLSCLTALQSLAISCVPRLNYIEGLLQLSQLTNLKLEVANPYSLEYGFTTPGTSQWACRTVLQSYAAINCSIKLGSVATFSQLRALTCLNCTILWSLQDSLSAVSQLSLLTQLEIDQCQRFQVCPASAADFAALTVSTNLCGLQLGLQRSFPHTSPVLFEPGIVYPHLRTIDLAGRAPSQAAAISDEQLQLLCSCCPALESLTFVQWPQPTVTTLQPLTQLSALSELEVYGFEARQSAAEAQAAAEVAAQLTGLKQLRLWGYCVPDTVLLQLTALTGLQDLGVYSNDGGVSRSNRARGSNPPDVWIELLRHLVRGAACRKALLQRSTAATAAPAELMLAQLAASVAEELAVARVPPS